MQKYKGCYVAIAVSQQNRFLVDSYALFALGLNTYIHTFCSPISYICLVCVLSGLLTQSESVSCSGGSLHLIGHKIDQNARLAASMKADPAASIVALSFSTLNF